MSRPESPTTGSGAAPDAKLIQLTQPAIDSKSGAAPDAADKPSITKWVQLSQLAIDSNKKSGYYHTALAALLERSMEAVINSYENGGTIALSDGRIVIALSIDSRKCVEKYNLRYSQEHHMNAAHEVVRRLRKCSYVSEAQVVKIKHNAIILIKTTPDHPDIDRFLRPY